MMPAEPMTTPRELGGRIALIRGAAGRAFAPRLAASALARTCELWRDREFSARGATVARIAGDWGFSAALLHESLDALLAPFTAAALEAFAQQAARRRETIGFIMAGNVAGAGLHEIATALIAGAGVVIKTASTEPHFFAAFARTLSEVAPDLGARIAVFNWNRADAELATALRSRSDLLVAYGDDETVARLGTGGQFIGFGSKLSGALVAPSALGAGRIDRVVAALARDIALFEQLGCLSPHHVFVLGGDARGFAARLADALAESAAAMPPPARLKLGDGAAIRRAREVARWRRIAGEPVELWEGAHLSWTVIFDSCAAFCASPGFRTVYVSSIGGLEELRARLAPARGALEAFAIAGGEAEACAARRILSAAGVSWICAPGEIQSPPLEWRHGGGAFLDLLVMHR